MDDNFSPRVKDVITYSKEEALRLGHDFIGTEHLMLGILRDGNGKAITILNNLSIDLEHLRKKVEILSPANPNVEISNEKKNLHLTRQAERALKTTFLEAKVFQSTSISTAHLLLCILRNENDPTTKLLHRLKTIIKRILLNSIPTFTNAVGRFSRTIPTFASRQMRLLKPKFVLITPQKTSQRPSLRRVGRFQKPVGIISNAFNRGRFLSTRFLEGRQKHRTASCYMRS